MLVTAPGEKFERDYFVEVLRRFPEVKSIHWVINDQPSEVTNLPSTLLWGDDAIEEELLGRRFRVRPNAFLQTNTGMAEKLYALAIEYAGLTGTETVYDLYCGTGTIGLSMANRRAQCLGRRHLGGVDRLRAGEPRPEPDRQRRLLRRATSARCWRSSPSAPALPTSSSSTRRAPVSPARRCGARASSARRGSSTSACNPTTLASDVKVLREQYGYELVRTKPVDMFRTRRTSRRSRC